ncbi:hypothetical protein P7D73_20170 [Enterococcus raffinosus]|uniref:hypothetical protein n=1 Tax=Enterococcus TaxID=1350 RepID=UPI00288EE4C4|nr:MULTISPECIES: hypothetical protein [Enterococcus]MDT2482667.1 hypothetical protein [Enterococcus avium]MDT2509363.1 hypothetical protein [Enterococcus avium]MDT2525577.1 hypothetical protein [Enterococcus raffinosus]MDT2536092.1 hypothetical protein [Enterococcus raffinosus]MDT2579900.1 hypothetical protein [Enterococcus raffinosus]
MKETQKTALKLMENQIESVGFTAIQSLTMGLSYFKGGYFDPLTDKEFEEVVKTFVEKHM